METVLDQVCASCGSARLPYGRYCLFCGDVLSEPDCQGHGCLPGLPTPLEQSATVSQPAIVYAGFWRRTWAGAIDVALEAAGALVVTFAIDSCWPELGACWDLSLGCPRLPPAWPTSLVLTIGAWLYCAFSESSSRRATIGKRILGLQVVTADGGRVSFGQATVRHFMKFLSLFSAVSDS